MDKRRGLGHARRCRRPLAQTKVRLRLSMARAYLRDLQAWKRVDANRFTRMVNGRGQQLGSPELWLTYIKEILRDPGVWTYQPGVARRVVRTLGSLGYHVQEGGD